MSDPVRAAFEAWHLKAFSFFCGLHDGDRYVDSNTRIRWEVWQASRAAALEEAAKACEEAVCCEDKGPDGVCCGQPRYQTADECAARIRAMVKP